MPGTLMPVGFALAIVVAMLRFCADLAGNAYAVVCDVRPQPFKIRPCEPAIPSRSADRGRRAEGLVAVIF